MAHPPRRAAVIVPCASIDALTRRCLRAVAADAPDADLIVVPDAPPPTYDLPGRCLPSGPVTIAAKRNLAARATEAPVLALIDSDAYPEPGWLAAALRILDADPSLGAVGGPNLSPPDAPASQRWVGNALRSPMVSGAGWFRKVRAPARRVDDHLPSCNLVVRKEVWEALGGMAEHLYAGEDRDLCERMIAAGRGLRYDPSVVVFHQDRDLRAFVAHRYRYGATLPPILKENIGRPGWERRYLPLLLPAGWVLFLASGPVLGLTPAGRRVWGGLVGLWAGALLAEGARLVDRPGDLPGTVAALALGNVVPGVGILAQVTGLGPGLGRVLEVSRPGR